MAGAQGGAPAQFPFPSLHIASISSKSEGAPHRMRASLALPAYVLPLPLSLATLRPPSWAPSRCQDHPLRFPTPSPPPGRRRRLLWQQGPRPSWVTPAPHRRLEPTRPPPLLRCLFPPSADPPLPLPTPGDASKRCCQLIPSSSAQTQSPRPGPSSFHTSSGREKTYPPPPRAAFPHPSPNYSQLNYPPVRLCRHLLSLPPPAAELTDYPRSRIPTRKTTAAQDPDPNVR